ncbi:hypothetical protein CTI12_AA196480 [Artemisia annua]|uniref:Uncharacterized protein n=1 Tax=Artemisia annua TaxID=35608 RepID=A0A2U1P435_ARTAN|nr:hypothetical protein CTI12_AA196480 [Artemisia annua]
MADPHGPPVHGPAALMHRESTNVGSPNVPASRDCKTRRSRQLHYVSASLDFGNAGCLQKSVLLKLIQEIEPLDVSVIQRDVPPTTVDAMKRTISGMLGLLPSDQFQVLIEALWKPLSKLLVSSLMTG